MVYDVETKKAKKESTEMNIMDPKKQRVEPWLILPGKEMNHLVFPI